MCVGMACGALVVLALGVVGAAGVASGIVVEASVAV